MQIWVEKNPQWNPGHMQKNACYPTRNECLSIYCRVIVTQQRPTAEQSASKFSQFASVGKGANCNLIIACLNKLTT